MHYHSEYLGGVNRLICSNNSIKRESYGNNKRPALRLKSEKLEDMNAPYFHFCFGNLDIEGNFHPRLGGLDRVFYPKGMTPIEALLKEIEDYRSAAGSIALFNGNKRIYEGKQIEKPLIEAMDDPDFNMHLNRIKLINPRYTFNGFYSYGLNERRRFRLFENDLIFYGHLNPEKVINLGYQSENLSAYDVGMKITASQMGYNKDSQIGDYNFFASGVFVQHGSYFFMRAEDTMLTIQRDKSKRLELKIQKRKSWERTILKDDKLLTYLAQFKPNSIKDRIITYLWRDIDSYGKAV
ncbi:hypothetical protein ACFL1H_00505 [Nanoarchaeota archaeon]